MVVTRCYADAKAWDTNRTPHCHDLMTHAVRQKQCDHSCITDASSRRLRADRAHCSIPQEVAAMNADDVCLSLVPNRASQRKEEEATLTATHRKQCFWVLPTDWSFACGLGPRDPMWSWRSCLGSPCRGIRTFTARARGWLLGPRATAWAGVIQSPNVGGSRSLDAVNPETKSYQTCFTNLTPTLGIMQRCTMCTNLFIKVAAHC